MHEKRAHTRRLMREDAVLSDVSGQPRHPVVLLDISRPGVCFASPTLLEGGTRRILQFKLPGSAELHETLVEVVHSSSAGVPSGYRVGARFTQIAAETTDAIVNFVSIDAPG